MRKRQSHNKSRRGCQNCKKKHVKCDEQGPPCANCVVRKLDCVYSRKNSPVVAALVVATQSSRSTPAQPKEALPPALTITPEFRRLLELELMHRWSTTTFKSICFVPEEWEYAPHILPRDALQFSYLLDGLFAFSALDLALNSSGDKRDVYLQAALEYYNRSSVAFRPHLDQIADGDINMIYTYSAMAAFMNLVIPECAPETRNPPKMVDRAKMFFSLTLATTQIALAHTRALTKKSLVVRATLESVKNASLEYLTESDRFGLNLLDLVHQQMAEQHLFVASDSDEHGNIPTARPIYQRVTSTLKFAFAEDGRGVINGACLGFSGMVGAEYLAVLDKGEPLALLMLSYWGVLMHRLASKYWWTRGIGKSVVYECSDLIMQSSLSLVPAVQDGIAWTKNQVEVDSLRPLMNEDSLLEGHSLAIRSI
ncbi:hypothetical protein BT63DRAFT_422145 [Microthyrium microscopicum]|uniref:Zn(2)-C6 fungal-type domain-containing protein n=1 Tax=Microthyrium microscopicum TaxID=703497 RepID=A0A6A6UL34_9PEZI|nr:hypothetical protein BT63DRAFT_422145 [Microthyrium microscopicum]